MELLSGTILGAPLALLAGVLASLASIIVIERVAPSDACWNHLNDDLAEDIGHTLVTLIVVGGIVVPATLAGGAVLHGSMGASPWPVSLPLAIQVLFALLAAELGPYWVHRLQHRVPLLWRFHSVRHSAARLCWFNTYRFHFLDLALVTVPPFGVLVLLGIPHAVAIYYLLFAYVIAFASHANVASANGVLGWLLVTPESHRWHHSADSAECDHNFGQSVIVWDWVFGTRYLPEGAGPQSVGARGAVRGVLAQLLQPFAGVRSES